MFRTLPCACACGDGVYVDTCSLVQVRVEPRHVVVRVLLYALCITFLEAGFVTEARTCCLASKPRESLSQSPSAGLQMCYFMGIGVPN